MQRQHGVSARGQRPAGPVIAADLKTRIWNAVTIVSRRSADRLLSRIVSYHLPAVVNVTALHSTRRTPFSPQGGTVPTDRALSW